MSKRSLIGPAIAVGGGLAAIGAAVYWRREIASSAVKLSDRVTDLVVPSKTGRKRVDAILAQLQAAAVASGIPLGLLIGWIIRESGGRLGEITKLDERGYFQLMPDESKKLGLDHVRLSTDSDYSIAGGIALVKSYMQRADALGIAPHGSSYYWKLVKLIHTMGSGAVDKVVQAARAAGAVGSWEALEKYAVDNDAELLHTTKHSPKKWFPLVDEVYASGKAFGFGSDTTVAGDNVIEGRTSDDHEALARLVESELGDRPREEQVAAAWAVRNRAAAAGVSVHDLLAPKGVYGSPKKSGGYASTRRVPTDKAREVAEEVLSAAVEDDPTFGAIEFWVPSKQAEMRRLGDVHRAAASSGDRAKALKYARYADYGTEDDVRDQFVRDGLRATSVVGCVELLGRLS